MIVRIRRSGRTGARAQGRVAGSPDDRHPRRRDRPGPAAVSRAILVVALIFLVPSIDHRPPSDPEDPAREVPGRPGLRGRRFRPSSVLHPSQAKGARVMSHEVIIETRNLTKVYRDFWGRPEGPGAQGPRPEGASRRDLRIARAQRFGEDDDDQAAAGPALPDRGRGADLQRADDERREERADRLPARGVVPLQVPQRRGDAPVLRAAVQDLRRPSGTSGSAS